MKARRPNINEAKKLLKWKPKTNYKNAIKYTVKYYLKMKVNFYKHTLNTKELRKIDNVFKSNILSTGKFCKLFEQTFSKI